RERSDAAETTWRVRVGVQPQLERFGARVAAPDLRVREEEALLGREAVDLALRLRLQRLLESAVRDANAAEVGGVLTQRQLAVHVHRVERDVGVVLLLDPERTLL